MLSITNRRRAVAANLLAGATYAEIAHALNVSKATIASDYKAILAEWRAHYAADADDLVQLQLRRYDVLLNAIWSDARGGSAVAIDRTLAIMDRQNALLGLTRRFDSAPPPPAISIIEVIRPSETTYLPPITQHDNSL